MSFNGKICKNLAFFDWIRVHAENTERQRNSCNSLDDALDNDLARHYFLKNMISLRTCQAF